ncbi:DUF3850 domain-containing protein [Mycobacteroides abscessus]|uniref:DUF3850 domain-containing protein n=1 Tax=Mycobacteroides abscessus TaxID=36809 RepID=UPI00092833A6|nr:DUF3850 domain-containing protein [Mycobacteroides abscessus]QST90592.1 RNA binding protein [Mycobacterium phage prophi52-1]MBN7332429.1 DUF3850 domain-containing protein [Mycobacteroides abscessus subsp. abscessus]SHX22913.1 Domain of Uncharacterised Function with PDB structure [Mycobacteroides abscessus subsp. abscessus]SHY14150.1 Domain of Uncharacterised Function with PDB structure [Mycobacteroides abscessus subsp. abscessus]SIA42510.1 Domain of Uncharacterised Function with PDB structu
MTTHYLKIESYWHDLLYDGSKTYEVRRADRDYQKGDRILFKVGSSEALSYAEWTITHVMYQAPWVADGYVVLSLEHPRKARREKEYEARGRSIENLRRSNAALRGVITRLRNQISMRDHQEVVSS